RQAPADRDRRQKGRGHRRARSVGAAIRHRSGTVSARRSRANDRQEEGRLAGGGGEQDVALLGARFAVRRAEVRTRLDNGLISANDYARRQLALEQAKQQLARLEGDSNARLESDRVALALVEEGRAKAQVAMDRAKDNINSLTITAPMDGLVVVRE